MEFRVSISEKAVFVLLIVTAIVSVIGITMAQVPDPGHPWSHIECAGCIETDDLADGSVTDAKIDAMSWEKITGKNFTLECYTTGWGALTSCLRWPEATPPDCDTENGYVFAGISAVTSSDYGCGHSQYNRQQVKSRCCRIV